MTKRNVLRTALAFLVAAATSAWTTANLGRWLVVEDPLEKADAIVVFGGMLPFRSMEAASFYRQGWAPEIWLPALEPSASFEYTKDLGLDPHDPNISLLVLDREQIPRESVRVLSPEVANTQAEVELVLDHMRRQNKKRLILVTSSFHTRRVRMLWNGMARDGEVGIVRYTPVNERFHKDRWWTPRQNRHIVLHEWGGIVGYLAGL